MYNFVPPTELEMTKVGNKVNNTVKFATFVPLTSTERLSTVLSPFLSFDQKSKKYLYYFGY